MAMQLRVIDVECGAIGADGFLVGAEIDENMRMVEWRERPDAHEFAAADTDPGESRRVVEMGGGSLSHESSARRTGAGTIVFLTGFG